MTPEKWREIVAKTTRMHGAIGVARLAKLGVSSDAARRLVAEGRLTRRHRGNYVVVTAAMSELAEEAAAVLACGESAAVGGQSATAAWGLENRPEGHIDIVVTNRHRVAPSGVNLFRATRLDRRDIRHKRDLRILSPARAILDRARVVGERDLERLIDKAQASGLVTESKLRDLVARCPREHGVARLRSVLDLRAGTGFTRSDYERRAREIFRKTGLPPGDWNVRHETDEIDVEWRDIGLAVEVDPYSSHGDREHFYSDRLKSTRNYVEGTVVLRMTDADIRDPIRFVTDLGRAYERRRYENGHRQLREPGSPPTDPGSGADHREPRQPRYL